MVAAQQLLTKITTYDARSMYLLRRKLEQVMLDDALIYGIFRLERTELASGYQFFALHIHTAALLGIVDVRGNLPKVIPRLTAYLHWLGFRHNNVRHVQCGATMPFAPQRSRRLPDRCIEGQYLRGGWVRDVWKDRDMPKLFDVE